MEIQKITFSSFNKLLLQKEELEQKHLHLLQVVESEKTAKWQYTRHCEDLSVEIKKLREEVNIETKNLLMNKCSHQLFTLKKEWRLLPQRQFLGSNRCQRLYITPVNSLLSSSSSGQGQIHVCFNPRHYLCLIQELENSAIANPCTKVSSLTLKPFTCI